MSGNNLLIVFGGTQEGSNIEQLDTGFNDSSGNRIKASSTVQSVFDEKALDEKDMDLFQFNFLTEKPSVSFRQAGRQVVTPRPDVEVDPYELHAIRLRLRWRFRSLQLSQLLHRSTKFCSP